MGLDVIAFKKMSVVKNAEYDECGNLVHFDTQWMPGSLMKWSEEHFPGRAEGLDANAVYEYESVFMFRAGSYSEYNEWRDKLEAFKGEEAFQELINFPDNEGVIGPVVAKKLYEDFKKYKCKAISYANENLEEEDKSWFISKYQEWQIAFEYASANGAVLFC